MFFWSYVSTVPLILCINCLSRRLFLLLLWSCVQCSSGPVCRLLLWSGIPKGSLVLRTCCCSDPVFSLFRWFCVVIDSWSFLAKGPLVSCVQTSPGPMNLSFLWSCVSSVPLFLCAQCCSGLVCILFFWSCVSIVRLVLCPQGFSSTANHLSLWCCVPTVPFFLKRLLFLSVQCSPAPVCPVFLHVCVPKGPLVHCGQSPMVLKTCCFSDALCPLLLNPTVTLTDPLVTGHWSLVTGPLSLFS